MTAREQTADEPGGLAFWIGLVLGWAVMAYALWGIVQEADATNPPGLARWVIGAALLHDLVFAPLVAVLGLVLARVLPARVRGPVLVASATTVLVLAYSYPLLRGFGRRPLNASALPRDYGTNVVIVVAAIWAVAAVVLAVRAAWARASRPTEQDA